VSARQTAERHAQDVADGNFPRLMGDFESSALSEFMAAGVMPPQPATRWQILSETPDGDRVRFRVRYSNETEQLELETTWQAFEGGVWKIVKAQKAGV
jgi:hypothetical protein